MFLLVQKRYVLPFKWNWSPSIVYFNNWPYQNKQYINLDCVDDDTWDNGHGHGCAAYTAQWCEDGQAKAGFEGFLGPRFKYPEKHCCACGELHCKFIGYTLQICMSVWWYISLNSA